MLHRADVGFPHRNSPGPCWRKLQMNTESRWPTLICHLTSGGAVMADGRDAGRALGDLAGAWRRGDLESCERLGPEVFDALDARRRQLLASPGFPTDFSVDPGTNDVVGAWRQCATAEASVALTVSLVAWITGRTAALEPRVPAMVSMSHPEWAMHFSDTWDFPPYTGPSWLPVGSRAATYASIMIAAAMLPEAFEHARRMHPGTLSTDVIEWLVAGRSRLSEAPTDDGRLFTAAAMFTIVTTRGAQLGMVDDPDERRMAAAAFASAFERERLGGVQGPLGARAIELAMRGVAPNRRAALAQRLEVLANSQHDACCMAELRSMAERLRAEQ